MLERTISQQPIHQDVLRYGGTVLVIDTDPLDLDTYADVFRSLGQTVARCDSYREAMHQIRSEHFELVVLDQGGDDFEGSVVLKFMSDLGIHVPVIALARQKTMQCYLEAMELGAEDYFEKPVSPAEISRVVTACILARIFSGALRE